MSVQPRGRSGGHAVPPVHRRGARPGAVRPTGNCGSRWTTSTVPTLRKRSNAAIPPGCHAKRVLRIVGAIAEALDYAHQRGLLHRDVKPANILLSQPGSGAQRILLADFGIARLLDEISGLTETNMTVGTVSYAAPEQLMDAAIDGRADQYSLAATAYHLFTGRPPFAHSKPVVVISTISTLRHLPRAKPTQS